MSAADFTVPILLDERAGIDRRSHALRIGVPFAKGDLDPTTPLSLVDAAEDVVPCEGSALARWSDGSVKWLLLDALVRVPAGRRTTYRLRPRSDRDRPSANNVSAIQVVELEDRIVVDTGAARFEISRVRPAPLAAVIVAGVNLLDTRGSLIRLRGPDLREHTPTVERVFVEQRGALRAAIIMEGKFACDAREAIRFRVRGVFIAGATHVCLELHIHNPRAAAHLGGLWDLGDPNSFFFRELALSLFPATSAGKVSWYAENAAETRTHEGDWILYQDSSGGANWNCANHVDARGSTTVSFSGYQVRASAEQPPLATGARATPCVSTLGSAGFLAATVEDFWQNFPKALRVQRGELTVALFPQESRGTFELQGGEQKRHVVLLEFGTAEASTEIPGLQQPPAVSIDPDWVERSRAVAWFVAGHRETNQRYQSYVNAIIEGPNAFVAKREVIDEYGWRNFGDIYADHEAVNHSGPEPFVSHYNNQYDFVYGGLVHYLRTSDARWRRLAEELARHTIDIDIYHTTADRSIFNGGLFWHTDHYSPVATCTHRTYSRENGRGAVYGGGPSNEHNYTSGLQLYYFLTGDPEARNAVLTLAEWVIAMDDGSRNILGLIDAGPTGEASKTGDYGYHKAGRGAGNSINALLDAYTLTGDRRFMAKAEEIIQRCIHPADDVEALGFRQPERRWSYLVFLQVLGKYLEVKIELGETDYAFWYARDSLLTYAQWIARHEVPYIDALDRVEIPTETWPAHDVRKCHVLHLAATYSPTEAQPSLRERAAFFFEQAIDGVLSFKTAYVARPLVILCVHGYSHAYFSGNAHTKVAVNQAHTYRFGEPQIFVAQRGRVRATLGGRWKVAKAELQRMWREMWYAMRRRS